MTPPVDPGRGAFDDYSVKLMLALVSAYDLQVDGDGNPLLDKNGNTIPTGLLNVQFLDRTGTREKVPFVMGLAGNTVMFGGLPEIGSFCIVGFRQQNQPVIVGFLPAGLANLFSSRGTIPNMVAGEVVVQSSIPDVDVEGNDNIFRGARLWLDRYGRIRLECQDYELIVGYLLSDEFTPTVSQVKDPITGNSIYLRERIAGGLEKRVDDQGNSVWTYTKNKIERIGGDVDVKVSGQVTQQATNGQTLQDDQGNLIQIVQGGKVRIVSKTGDVYIFAQGNLDEEIAGQETKKVMLSIVTTTGEQFNLIVGKDYTEGVSGKKTVTVTGGDSVEKVTQGKKQITANDNVEVKSLTAKIKLQGGGRGASGKGHHSDAGQLILAIAGQATLSGSYVDPDGTTTPVTSGSPIALKAKLTEASPDVEID